MTEEVEVLVELLRDVLGHEKQHYESKGQISFDCPVCAEEKGLDEGDGKGNLEINYKMLVYKCWSCSELYNTHGSVYKLIKKYGNEKHLKRYELLKPDEVELAVKQFKQVELPKEFIALSNPSDGVKLTHHYRQAMAYLKKRNVTDKIIRKHNIGFAFSGPYENRIIIPSYNEWRQINYFVARSFLSKTKLSNKKWETQISRGKLCIYKWK